MAKFNPLKSDRIGPMALVLMEGETFVATRPTSRGWELTTGGSRPRTKLLTHAELDRGEDDGSIVVKRQDKDVFAVANMTLSQRRDMFIKDTWMRLLDSGLRLGTLSSLGDKALEEFIEGNEVTVREELAKWSRDSGFDSALQNTRKPNVGTASEMVELAPSTRHMRRLYKRYLAGSRHPLSMRKRTETSDKGGHRISGLVARMLKEVAESYASEANPTVAGLHKLLKARIGAHNAGLPKELREIAPSEATVARRIDDLPEGQKIGGRENARAIHTVMGPKGKGPEYRRVGERSEHDCWNIPLFLLLKKAGVLGEVPTHIRDELKEKSSRITVAAVVDKATGYFTGMRFGLSENSDLTTAALRMSLTDKSRYAALAGCEAPWDLYSGIEEGATDGGPAYTGDKFLSAAIPAFGRHVYTAGGIPNLRGLVESIFSMLHKGFISKFVARAFENVVAKGDYEAELRAVFKLEDFLLLMIRYVVDVYHNLPRNGGLRQSPRREFEAKAPAMDTKPPPTPEEIRVWFGLELTRALGPQGIQFMHIRYDSNWLVKYRVHMGLEEVTIRVDPEDLGAIAVLLDGDWITVPALDREFRGIALVDWVALLADMRARFGAEAEVDFHRFVAPALLHIDATSREAERAFGLQGVIWTEEMLQTEEDRLIIRPVYDDDPSNHAQTPSFGSGSLGRRYARKEVAETAVAPPLPVPQSSGDDPPPAVADEALMDDTPSAPQRRRLKFLED